MDWGNVGISRKFREVPRFPETESKKSPEPGDTLTLIDGNFILIDSQ
jgi:hypothetical protein